MFFIPEIKIQRTLFNSLVRCRLEYCCQVWDPSTKTQIDKIEQIQRSFTSKIEFMDNYNYWERLEKLSIMSLQRRREKLAIIFIWKIKNNLVPNVINLEFSKTTRRSGTTATVKPMPSVKGRLLSNYENSFTIKAAKLWNKLPPNLREVTELRPFCNELKKFLSLFPDLPPIRGYFHIDNNSILDYKHITGLTSA